LSTEGRTIVLVTHDPEIAAVTRAVSRSRWEDRATPRFDAGRIESRCAFAGGSNAGRSGVNLKRARYAEPPSSQDVLEQGLPHSSQLIITVQTGLREIWAHKFRSLLTMLGIILGVSSLVAMSALVAAWKRARRKLRIGGTAKKFGIEPQKYPLSNDISLTSRRFNDE